MTFSIDRSALQRLDARMKLEAPRCVTICEQLRRAAVSTGSVSSVGTVNPLFLPLEVRLATRMALLSFETDWNAPGMEAYDAL